MREIYDLIIVGAGPAGLSALIYANRAQMKTLIIEKSVYGGQIINTSEIVNYPGISRTSGQDLMTDFYKHAMSKGQKMQTATVTGIELDGDIKVIKTRRHGSFYARALILNLGCTPRKLGIPGEEEFMGAGVAYCATCDAAFFKDQQVFVLGSGDAALEEAEYIAKFAAKVTILVLHDEGIMDCNNASKARALRNPRLDFVWNVTLREINGNTYVTGLVLQDVKTGVLEEREADGIFFFIGSVPNTKIISQLVVLDAEGYVVVNNKMETNVPGIFAVGDCTQKYLRQVITAAADGAVAAVAASKYVDGLLN